MDRSLAVIFCVATIAACRRSKTHASEVATIAPEPTSSTSAAPSASVSATSAPSTPPHVIAMPACTPSSHVAWIKSPSASVRCSQSRSGLDPITIDVAKGTPVRLHLRAADGAVKGAFKGTYVAEGLPSGAKLDAHTGEFSWTASASAAPIEIGFAAIASGASGDCVTEAFAIHVVDDDATRANLLRWRHYIELRDADLASIPSDEELSKTVADGETPEMTLARIKEEMTAAHAATQKYLDDLQCGMLPGGSLDEEDVDADKNVDAVFSLQQGRDSFVVLRPKSGDVTLGKILGSPTQRTLDGHAIFVDEIYAENAHEVSIAWVDGGTIRDFSLDGDASSAVEWKTGAKDLEVALVEGGARKEYAWTGSDFSPK